MAMLDRGAQPGAADVTPTTDTDTPRTWTETERRPWSKAELLALIDSVFEHPSLRIERARQRQWEAQAARNAAAQEATVAGRKAHAAEVLAKIEFEQRRAAYLTSKYGTAGAPNVDNGHASEASAAG